MLISGHLLPPGSASGSGIVVSGGERRLRPWGTALMGSGGRGRFGQLPAYLGEGRLIRPPRTTAGPPSRGLEADRERTGAADLPGAESSGRPGPAPETRPPTRAEARGLKERRTFRSNPDAVS